MIIEIDCGRGISAKKKKIKCLDTYHDDNDKFSCYARTYTREEKKIMKIETTAFFFLPNFIILTFVIMK